MTDRAQAAQAKWDDVVDFIDKHSRAAAGPADQEFLAMTIMMCSTLMLFDQHEWEVDALKGLVDIAVEDELATDSRNGHG